MFNRDVLNYLSLQPKQKISIETRYLLLSESKDFPFKDSNKYF